MISKLKLYFRWGIEFEDEYRLPDKTAKAVSYMERDELIKDIEVKYPRKKKAEVIEEIEISDEEEPYKKMKVKTGDDDY